MVRPEAFGLADARMAVARGLVLASRLDSFWKGLEVQTGHCGRCRNIVSADEFPGIRLHDPDPKPRLQGKADRRLRIPGIFRRPTCLLRGSRGGSFWRLVLSFGPWVKTKA